jgi:hypothetical protein
VTHDGFLFISDHEDGRIVRIAPDGETTVYAGGSSGFLNSAGESAKFNGPSSVAIDRQGVVYVADSRNYLVREIVPSLSPPATAQVADVPAKLFIQPPEQGWPTKSGQVVPIINATELGVGQSFPWPLSPQGNWHEITGVVGEARGAAGGIALDHLHAGLDIRGVRGDAVFSVMDEKTRPCPDRRGK